MAALAKAVIAAAFLLLEMMKFTGSMPPGGDLKLPKNYLCLPLTSNVATFPPLQMKFAGMMQYDGDLKLPKHYLVPPPDIERASEQYVVANGLSVFACAESQKVRFEGAGMASTFHRRRPCRSLQ